jgi:hypothetical protein
VTVSDTFSELAAGVDLSWWHEFFGPSLEPTVIQYEIEGDDSGSWYAVIGNDDPSCTVHAGLAARTDLRLVLSDRDWLDLVADRTSVWPLLASERARAEGERHLIAHITTMGLLGLPVTSAEVKGFPQPWFHSSDRYWVLPRVLTAGQLDHAKWRYFVEQGDLVATAVSPGAWPLLDDEGVEANHMENLRRALKPVWWQLRLLDTLRVGLACVSLFLVLIVAWLAPWWLALLATALIVCALVVALGIVGADDAPQRYATVFTRLAYDDPGFFRFALERRLMLMSSSWRLEK